MSLVLVLGGTRSGKSQVAERLAAAAPQPVTYVATAWVDPDDADHAARIDHHRQRRPDGWATVECPQPDRLPSVLAAADGTVLLDSLGTWVAGHDVGSRVDPSALLSALTARSVGATTIIVAEEVGSAPHAPTEAGRWFVDQLGAVNHAVSLAADRALLVVAGRALELPPPPGAG